MSCDICHVLTRLLASIPHIYKSAHLPSTWSAGVGSISECSATLVCCFAATLLVPFRLWTEQEARQVTRAERLP